jgi:hypothetical protein
MESAANITN